MSDKLDTRVIQVTNIAPSVTKDQMKTLFNYLGRIDEIKLYPSERSETQVGTRVCYVKYDDTTSVGVALHLANTVFIDRALVIVPVMDGKIPDEQTALQMAPSAVAGMIPGQPTWPSNVISQLQGTGLHQEITTNDPRLTALGLPQYPPLPGSTDPSKIEEIRRTVYISNLEPVVTGQQILGFFSQVGEIKYVRMGGEGAGEARCAYVEFSDQRSVATALTYNGVMFGSSPLKVSHSLSSIIKPKSESQKAAQREIEEAMKKVKEAQSLITAAADSGDLNIDKAVSRLASGIGRSRSRSGSRYRSRSRRSRSRRRSRSHRSRSRRRSRSASRKKSKSVSPPKRKLGPGMPPLPGSIKKRENRSRSRHRKSRSRSRTRRRSRSRSRKRSRTPSSYKRRSRRSRSRSKTSRRRSRSRKRSRSRDRKRSRSRDRKRSKSRDRKRTRTRSKSPVKKKSRSRSLSIPKLKRADSESSSSSGQSRSRSRSPVKKSRRSRSRSRSRGRRSGKKSRRSRSRSTERRKRSRSRKKSRSRSGSRHRSSRKEKKRDRDRSRDRSHDREKEKSKKKHKEKEKDREEKKDSKVKRDYDEEEMNLYDDLDRQYKEEEKAAPIQTIITEKPDDSDLQQVDMDMSD